MVELVDHVRLGRPKAAREFYVLLWAQLLIAQHQHLATEERLLELEELGFGERPRDIDVGGLQPEAIRQWREIHDGNLGRSDRITLGTVIFDSITPIQA